VRVGFGRFSAKTPLIAFFKLEINPIRDSRDVSTTVTLLFLFSAKTLLTALFKFEINPIRDSRDVSTTVTLLFLFLFFIYPLVWSFGSCNDPHFILGLATTPILFTSFGLVFWVMQWVLQLPPFYFGGLLVLQLPPFYFGGLLGHAMTPKIGITLSCFSTSPRP